MVKRSLPAGQAIPDSDTVARFCEPQTTLDSSGRVTGAAFLPRPVDQGRVSVEWCQCVPVPTGTTQLDAVRRSLSERVREYTNAGKIALLNVGVVHLPTRRGPCHAAITGVEGLLALPLAEMLSELANENAVQA